MAQPARHAALSAVPTPRLFHFIDHAACIQDLHFMLQKEVESRGTKRISFRLAFPRSGPYASVAYTKEDAGGREP